MTTVNRSGPPRLSSLLFEHPKDDADALLHTVDRSVTAGQAKQQAHDMADSLGELAGRAVAVQLPNSPELVTTMVGIWEAGGVYVPLNPRQPTSEVAAILADLHPVAVIRPEGIEWHDEATTYSDDVACVLWTSGTTGAPKPVRHTHAGYLEMLSRVADTLTSSRSATSSRPRVNLIPVSMSLNAGFYNTLFALRVGASVVIMDQFEPETFAALVSRFEIPSCVLPPAAMTMLTNSPVTSLAPLRYVRSITAPLSPFQARRFAEKFNVRVLNSYGQVELGEVIGWTADQAKTFPHKIGAAGKPLKGVEARLDPEGRLLIRVSGAAKGIEGRLDSEGFIDTGDYARIDDDGFVWIEGRASDMINRGGNKVYPDTVEEVLLQSAAVDDVAVVGQPDDRLGEVPVAFLVGRSVPDADLASLCRQHLVPYKIPVSFHWVEQIPRNEIGKILRRQLVPPAREDV